MKIGKIITILLSICFFNTYAQNDKSYRDEFMLKLPVDGKQFYEQKVDKSPYFVKDKILQIYSGEKLFIEVEITQNKITSMKVVKENLNPKKTIKVELTQEVKDSISESMILKIENPFKKDLDYKAMMFIVGQNKWIQTNVLPIKAKLSSFEIWSDVIITMVLSDWNLK